jgi:hypothetical protein
VESLVGVGYQLELAYVTLVDTEDELVSTNNDIKKKNEAI